MRNLASTMHAWWRCSGIPAAAHEHAAAVLMRLGYHDAEACEDIMDADGIENLAVLLHAQESTLRCVIRPLTMITPAALLKLQATCCEVVHLPAFSRHQDSRSSSTVCDGNRSPTVRLPYSQWNHTVGALQYKVHEWAATIRTRLVVASYS